MDGYLTGALIYDSIDEKETSCPPLIKFYWYVCRRRFLIDSRPFQFPTHHYYSLLLCTSFFVQFLYCPRQSTPHSEVASFLFMYIFFTFYYDYHLILLFRSFLVIIVHSVVFSIPSRPIFSISMCNSKIG